MAERIGVLTSGGDAPGMNAAIRAVVRAGIYYGYEIYGIQSGYNGLIEGEFQPMNLRSVSDIMSRGGTILKTSRSKLFETPEGRARAIENLKSLDINSLVVIGGDGSYRGARELSRESSVNVVGIPGTIDNDIGCTEYTIGYDTALNTVRDCIDRIKDTAFSHDRCSIIEVMGHHAGYIALNSAIAGGAEACILPEKPFDLERDIIQPLVACRARGKKLFLIIVSEGAYPSYKLAGEIQERMDITPTVSILGYIQRGGSPTVRDRLMASLMGVRAVDAVRNGERNVVVASRAGEIVTIGINEALEMKKEISPDRFVANSILSL